MTGLLQIFFAFGVPRLLKIFISEEKFFLKKVTFCNTTRRPGEELGKLENLSNLFVSSGM